MNAEDVVYSYFSMRPVPEESKAAGDLPTWIQWKELLAQAQTYVPLVNESRRASYAHACELLCAEADDVSDALQRRVQNLEYAPVIRPETPDYVRVLDPGPPVFSDPSWNEFERGPGGASIPLPGSRAVDVPVDNGPYVSRGAGAQQIQYLHHEQVLGVDDPSHDERHPLDDRNACVVPSTFAHEEECVLGLLMEESTPSHYRRLTGESGPSRMEQDAEGDVDIVDERRLSLDRARNARAAALIREHMANDWDYTLKLAELTSMIARVQFCQYKALRDLSEALKNI